MAYAIKIKNVKLVSRILKPWCDEGMVSVPEYNEIVSQLKSLAEKGEILPAIQPRLVNQDEVAEMLGISKANFKAMERDGKIPIPRRMVGSSVRYRLTDVVMYINADGDACDHAIPVD